MGMLVTDEHRRILWINDMLAEWVGIPAEQLTGRPAGALNVDWLDGGAPEGTLAIRQPGGTVRDLHYRRREVEAPGGGQLSVYALMDVSPWLTEVAQLKEAMDTLSVRDDATGLLNHRGLAVELESQVARSRRYGNALTVVRLDIVDRGGAGREALLRSLAHLFNDQLRWADTVGRWDANAFLCILPETGRESAVVLAGKLIEALAQLSPGPRGRTSPVTAHCAVTAWREGDDPRRMLGRLSDLLQQAGASGESVVEG